MKDGMTGPARQTHALSTGVLTLTIHERAQDNLFRVAERRNPKRAFLFVSTVLGRHIPVDPVHHRLAVEALADRIVPHVGTGPVFLMSYAETAIGLGLAVFDALAGLMDDRPMGYLPTTRFEPSGLTPWLTTREDHSHAVDHMVFQPAFADMASERDATLVLVDDETTTGRTFSGLAAGLKTVGADPARIVLVTLTDWSDGAVAHVLRGVFPKARVRAVSLLSGTYAWSSAEGTTPRALPSGRAAECPAWTPAAHAPFSVPRTGIDAAAHRGERAAWQSFVNRGLLGALAEDACVLVIGTGEHVWHPFLAAERIAATGRKTRFIATTRSPVARGPVVPHQMSFPDHYGLGLPMYLNNVRPEAWDEILVFTETGFEGISDTLRTALGKGYVITPDAIRTMAGDLL